ncbi:MAG TPA: hypothetical protein VMS78_08540 [Rhizomicrobium sp.]|nr:hypothetical protein [Rhizomicrobium sp.]
MAIFEPGTPFRNKIGFFIGAPIFLCGMGVAFWDRAHGEFGRSLIGFAVALSPIALLIIWSKWKASRDPVYARKMEEIRARRRPQVERQQKRRMRSLTAHVFGLVIASGIMLVAYKAGITLPASWHVRATTAFFVLYGICTAGFTLLQASRNRSQNAA